MKSPEEIIREQLTHYNIRDLDRFSSLFHPSVKAYSFPDIDKTIMEGKPQLVDRYRERFDSSPELYSHLKDRIVLGNFVVDDEDIAGFGGENVRIIAIYEVQEELITRMWFIRGEEDSGVIQPVEGQLQGYNTRDIDTFMENYAEDCRLYDLSSGEISMEGTSAMRDRYGKLFETSPELNAKVVQRFFLDDFVIDFEHVSGFRDNSEVVEVIAINQVQSGLITAVWFAR